MYRRHKQPKHHELFLSFLQPLHQRRQRNIIVIIKLSNFIHPKIFQPLPVLIAPGFLAFVKGDVLILISRILIFCAVVHVSRVAEAFVKFAPALDHLGITGKVSAALSLQVSFLSRTEGLDFFLRVIIMRDMEGGFGVPDAWLAGNSIRVWRWPGEVGICDSQLLH